MVQDQCVRVRRDGRLAEVHLPVGDTEHHDRVPQRRVQGVELHVARGVTGEFGVPRLHPVPAEELRQPRLAEGDRQVLEEAVQVHGPAEVHLARGQGRHLPVEDGDRVEPVVDDVPDAGVAPVEDRFAGVGRPEVGEPVEGALDEG